MSEFSPISLARSNVSCGIATTAKTSFLDPATDKNVQGACHRRATTGVLHQNCDFRSLDIPVRVLASKFSKVERLVRHRNHCQDIISRPRDINNECQGACHRRNVTGGMSRCLSPACYRQGACHRRSLLSPACYRRSPPPALSPDDRREGTAAKGENTTLHNIISSFACDKPSLTVQSRLSGQTSLARGLLQSGLSQRRAN